MKNTTAHRRGIIAHAPSRTYVIMMILPFRVDLPFLFAPPQSFSCVLPSSSNLVVRIDNTPLHTL